MLIGARAGSVFPPAVVANLGGGGFPLISRLKQFGFSWLLKASKKAECSSFSVLRQASWTSHPIIDKLATRCYLDCRSRKETRYFKTATWILLPGGFARRRRLRACRRSARVGGPVRQPGSARCRARIDALHRECGGCRFTAGGPASGGVKRSRRAHAVAALASGNFEISETRDMEIKK